MSPKRAILAKSSMFSNLKLGWRRILINLLKSTDICVTLNMNLVYRLGNASIQELNLWEEANWRWLDGLKLRGGRGLLGQYLVAALEACSKPTCLSWIPDALYLTGPLCLLMLEAFPYSRPVLNLKGICMLVPRVNLPETLTLVRRKGIFYMKNVCELVNKMWPNLPRASCIPSGITTRTNHGPNPQLM